MRVAVLGTGTVGQHLAAGLADLGHEVVVGTRDVAESLARTTAGWGAQPMSAWLEAHQGVRLASFADALQGVDFVVNATAGTASLDTLRAAGVANLRGTVLLDVANPLVHREDGTTLLAVCNDDSLAERIQREFPDLRVVKSLNTMNAAVMVDPDPNATTFVSGDDAAAKAQVVELLRSLGHRDVLDLGDIRTARGPEMALVLWLGIAGATGSYDFGLRVVRRGP